MKFVYHGKVLWEVTNRLKERIRDVEEDKRGVLLEKKKLKKENEKLVMKQKSRSEKVIEAFENMEKLFEERLEEMRRITKEYESKEKEMKEKQDDLKNMLAESNESCEELGN